MTRVLVVDDQPAVSSAPVGAFRADPGLVALVTADSMSGARRATGEPSTSPSSTTRSLTATD